MNNGTVNNEAHKAVQVARDACVYRCAPYACATNVCTARPTPPNSNTHTKIGQYTAPTPDVAAGDKRPTNQVSVAFSTACTPLLSMKGKASVATAA